MKKFRNVLAVFIAAMLAAVCFAVPSSAAGISSAKKWANNTNVSVKAQADKTSTAYLKMSLSGAGKLTFYIYEQNITKASKYELLTSKGKTIKSGKLSSLHEKTFKVAKKGTYYLKLRLAKGESVEYFRYTFFADGAYPTATEKWLTDYTLTDAEITQLNRAFATFIWQGGFYFEEGKITEGEALDIVLDNCTGFTNPYGYDKTASISEAESFEAAKNFLVPVSGKAVDDTLYHLFGIKASHNADSPWKYYKNGNYFYGDGAKGCYDMLEYVSNEKTDDGRFIVKFRYSQFDVEKSVDLSDEGAVFNISDVYALVSVHETDGKKYVRIHSVYKG